MKKIDNLVQRLEELNLDVDFASALQHCDIEHIYDFDDIWEALDDKGFLFVDIIYYHDAIKFLAENDPSLRNSLALANEFGFKVEELNSEQLASFLATEMHREKIQSSRDEINEIIKEELVQ